MVEETTDLQGLPSPEGDAAGLPAPEAYRKHGDHFELSKTYFVGHQALAEVRETPDLPVFAWQEPENEPLKRTVLYEWHKAHTRHIVPFAGWEMPVWYTGVLDEHNVVRKAAGLFDVSHMGVFEATGPHAEEFLDLVLSNYVRWYAPGESFYAYLLDVDGWFFPHEAEVTDLLDRRSEHLLAVEVACPMPVPGNTLPFAVLAGERSA